MGNSSHIFANYQVEKLDIIFPDLTNTVIIAVFFLLMALTGKKSAPDDNNFMSPPHTDSVRGFAIFFVVLGHLWVHVSGYTDFFYIGTPVSMFLLVSGFGITLSAIRKEPRFKEYILKRTRKVLVPYWMATVVILALDYIMLGKTLQTGSVVLTFLGINLRPELLLLDYVRWFVTFILLWYAVFFLAYKPGKPGRTAIILIGTALCTMLLNYYLLQFTWMYFLSFPAGCILALYYAKCFAVYQKKRKLFLVLSVPGIAGVTAYDIAMTHTALSVFAVKVPSILLVLVSEITCLISNAGIICLVGCLIQRGYRSGALKVLGRYSYEIFLLHGIFLVKYNPVIKDTNLIPVALEFFVFMSLILIVASLAARAFNAQYIHKTWLALKKKPTFNIV